VNQLPKSVGAGNPHATFCGNRGRATASGDPVGVETGATGDLVRHRQPKGAATDRVDLKPPASHSDSTISGRRRHPLHRSKRYPELSCRNRRDPLTLPGGDTPAGARRLAPACPSASKKRRLRTGAPAAIRVYRLAALAVGAELAARRRIGRASLSYRLRLRFVHAEHTTLSTVGWASVGPPLDRSLVRFPPRMRSIAPTATP
jgi:hypothetical protein